MALRRDAPAPGRRAGMVLGIASANLPDLDLLYTGITAEPLGYLLHHRGHTHTVVGLVVQALLLLAAYRLPGLSRALATAATPRRTLALVAAGLGSHLVMDAWNSYGVHPFYPLDNGWYYGDAVFIFEPALWVVLGAAAAANATRRRWRAGLVLLVAVTVGLLARLGVLEAVSLAGLVVLAAVFVGATRRLEPGRRSLAALGVATALVASLFALGSVAHGRTRRAAADRVVLDVVLNPNPAAPWCWALISVEHDRARDELLLRRGTLSLWPARPAAQCPSHRLTGLPAAGGELAWGDERRTALVPLGSALAADCHLRAWHQFGRAPYLAGGHVADLRFDSGPRGNFTRMPLAEGRPCPAALTAWEWPRADVLRP